MWSKNVKNGADLILIYANGVYIIIIAFVHEFTSLFFLVALGGK